MLIHPLSRWFRYFFTGTIEEAGLSSWINDWLEGKVKPTLKSAAAPHETDNKGHVRIVVGKTFDHEVIKSQKDVMVMFHAPW